MKLAIISALGDKWGHHRPQHCIDWDTGEIISGPFEFHVGAGTGFERKDLGDGRWAFIREGELHGGSRRLP